MSAELQKHEEQEKEWTKIRADLEDKVKALESALELAASERDVRVTRISLPRLAKSLINFNTKKLKEKQGIDILELQQLRVDHAALKGTCIILYYASFLGLTPLLQRSTKLLLYSAENIKRSWKMNITKCCVYRKRHV